LTPPLRFDHVRYDSQEDAMPQQYPVTEATIASLDVDDRVYERGEQYLARGAVLRVVQRGNLITAAVEGSMEEPYTVVIRLGKDRVQAVACDCPYMEEWDGVCKHVVAALLAVQGDESVEYRPSIAELVAALDAPQLRTLLTTLVDHHPGVADTIDQLAQQTKKR
jgi:uncharacterized Zn finger protein